MVVWIREFLEDFIILETSERVDEDSIDRESFQSSSTGKPSARKKERFLFSSLARERRFVALAEFRAESKTQHI